MSVSKKSLSIGLENIWYKKSLGIGLENFGFKNSWFLTEKVRVKSDLIAV